MPQLVNLPVEVEDGTLVEQQTYVNCTSGAQSRNLDAARRIVEAFSPLK